MKLNFDVNAREYTLLRDILAQHLPKDVKVWVFGSRAKNTARFNSDLDLALEGNAPLSDKLIARLKEEFSEALIPYRVDVLDVVSVSDKFREIIRQQAVPFEVTASGTVPELRFPDFDDEWQNAPISDWLSKVIDYRGKAPPKTETGIPLITARNVKMGHLDFEADEYIDSELFEAWMNRGRPNSGDVMFTTEAPLGNVAQFPTKGVYALGQRIITLQPDKENCDSGFLFQSLLGPKMQRKVEARGTGSTAKGIKSRLFVKIPMNAPTLPEQRKIAGFLGAVDTKIAQLAEKKRLLEDYKKGCMQQLFSQKIRFTDDTGNDFPDWEEKRLGEVSTVFSGGTPSSSNRLYYNGELPFIGSGDISSDHVQQFISESALAESSAKLVNEGDLLYALYGATSGEVAISKISGAINQAVLCIRSTENTLFLYHWLRHSKETITSTYLQGGQGNLSGKIVKALRIPLPHPDEQRKIADFLSALDRRIDLVGQKLTHARTFKQGLLQQMFV